MARPMTQEEQARSMLKSIREAKQRGNQYRPLVVRAEEAEKARRRRMYVWMCEEGTEELFIDGYIVKRFDVLETVLIGPMGTI